jgi:hypothetical protein
LDKCVTCVFFDRGNGASSGTAWGQCRRMPPTLHPVNVKSYMIEGVWPHVREDDWCGQWLSPARIARAEPAHAPAAASRPAAPAAARMVTPLPGGGSGAPASPALALQAGD